MFSAEREYHTARAYLSFVAAIAWIIAILGLILALVGFVTGGIYGIMSRGFGSPADIPFLVRLVSAIPGLIIAYGGFVGVAWSQVQRATVDTTSMTRMILELTRKQAKANTHNPNMPPNPGPKSHTPPKQQGSSANWTGFQRQSSGRPSDAIVEEEYKGAEIYKTNHGNYVGDKWFPNIDRARKFIDEQSEKSDQ